MILAVRGRRRLPSLTSPGSAWRRSTPGRSGILDAFATAEEPGAAAHRPEMISVDSRRGSGVDGHRGAGDERGAIRAQPDDGFGDLLGLTQALDRLQGMRAPVALGRQRLDHRRRDRRRADGVDADVVGTHSIAAVLVRPTTACLLAT